MQTSPWTEAIRGLIRGMDSSAALQGWEPRSEKGHLWLPPVDVETDAPQLPPFDPDLLPEPFADWIIDTAARTGAPLAGIAVSALWSAGVVSGNTLRAYPKQQDEGWTETPNLYALLVGGPSTKKSLAANVGKAMLEDLQASEVKRHKRMARRRKQDAAAADQKLQELEGALSANEDPVEGAELERQYDAELQRHERAIAGRRNYLVNDTTTQKLARLHAEPANRGGIGIFRDEMSGLFASMKGSGHENDRAFYLEGHAGTNQYNVHRVHDGSTDISTFTLAILGTIQPTELRTMADQARTQYKDDGFLQRFQATVWMPLDGTEVDRPPDKDALKRAKGVFDKIAEQAQEREATLDNDDYEAVHLALDAQELLDAWWKRQLPEMRRAEEEGHTAYAGHIGKGHTTVTRLALIYHLIDRADGGSSESITLSQAQRAVRLADYLLRHAQITYRTHISPRLDPLLRLRSLIADGRIEDGMTFRNFQRSARTIGNTKDELMPVLKQASELNWLRLDRTANENSRESDMIWLNPQLQEH